MEPSRAAAQTTQQEPQIMGAADMDKGEIDRDAKGDQRGQHTRLAPERDTAGQMDCALFGQ